MNYSDAYIYSATDIESITDGSVSPKTLNHWSTKGQWFHTPQHVERGYTRRFSRLQVIEAVITRECGIYGIPRYVVTSLFRHRAFQLRCKRGVAYSDQIGVHFPEFEPGSDWYWVCDLRCGAGLFAFSSHEQAAEYVNENLSAVIINLGRIVSRVDSVRKGEIE